MPFITLKTNAAISPAAQADLTRKLGEAIALIPEKSERWLMLAFEANLPMAFGGKRDATIAFFDVKLYGEADARALDPFTARATEIARETLNAAPDQVYVAYAYMPVWGFNGGNF